jgi:thiosulfate dehydrogenase
VRSAATLVLCAISLAFGACSGNSHGAGALYDRKHLPPGPMGQTIAYGHDLIANTQELMKPYVRADMACAACHIDAGTSPRGNSLAGIYARFPQWNARSHRVIALQDRIAECFLRSMNGRPPAYQSKEMIAMVAYLAWISRDAPVGQATSPPQAAPALIPDRAAGATIYAQKCARCHQAVGAGISGIFPPLWGSTSFNSGAGMAKIAKMAPFVQRNMPQDSPGSLTEQQAYDVSAYVLSHGRPTFDGDAPVSWPPQPAKTF